MKCEEDMSLISSSKEATKWQCIEWKAENSHIAVSYFKLYWRFQQNPGVSKFIKTIATFLQQIELSINFVGGRNYLPWGHWLFSLCWVGRKSPRSTLNYRLCLEVLYIGWRFSLQLLPKSNYQMRWTLEVWSRMAALIPIYHSSMGKDLLFYVLLCLLMEDRKSRKQEHSYQW